MEERLTTAFTYVFVTIAPFVAINLLGMSSETYGIANIVPALGYIIGAVFSARLAIKWALLSIVKIGTVLVVVGIVWMIVAVLAHLSP